MEQSPIRTTNEYNWFDGNPPTKGAWRTRQAEGSANYAWRYWDGQNWHTAQSTYRACVEAFKSGERRNPRQARALLWGKKRSDPKHQDTTARAAETETVPGAHAQTVETLQRIATAYETRLLTLLNALGCGRPGNPDDIRMLGQQPVNALSVLGRVIAEQASKAPDSGALPDEITAAFDYAARNEATFEHGADSAGLQKDDLMKAFRAGALHQRISTHMIREKLGVISWPVPGDTLVDSRVYFAPEVRALIARAVTADRESNQQQPVVEWTSERGQTTTLTLEQAGVMLRELYDRWPGGLNEIDAALDQRSVRMLSTGEIDHVFNTMPGGRTRYMIEWGYSTFAREILKLALRKKRAVPDESDD